MSDRNPAPVLTAALYAAGSAGFEVEFLTTDSFTTMRRSEWEELSARREFCHGSGNVGDDADPSSEEPSGT